MCSGHPEQPTQPAGAASGMRSLPGDPGSSDSGAELLSCDQVRRTCAWGAHRSEAEAGEGSGGWRILDLSSGSSVLTVGGTTLMLEMRERGSAPKLREVEVAGYTSLDAPAAQLQLERCGVSGPCR